MDIVLKSYFPKLCLWRVPKAIIAATAWTMIDENSAQRNIWYHISGKRLKKKRTFNSKIELNILLFVWYR